MLWRKWIQKAAICLLIVLVANSRWCDHAYCQQLLSDATDGTTSLLRLLLQWPGDLASNITPPRQDTLLLLPGLLMPATFVSGAEDSLQEETQENTATAGSTLTAIDEESAALLSHYAEVISTDASALYNYPLYSFIDKWYGTPYKWGGTDNRGIDCSAFSQKLYGSIYGIHIRRTARLQHRTCDELKDIDEAQEGDLVFFRMHRIRISHVGIYLANGYFVHASRSRGVVISCLNDRYWHRRFAGCGHMQTSQHVPSESEYLQ